MVRVGNRRYECEKCRNTSRNTSVCVCRGRGRFRIGLRIGIGVRLGVVGSDRGWLESVVGVGEGYGWG